MKKRYFLMAGAAAACAAWRALERERLRRSIEPGARIVILGAGFAGTQVARRLVKLLPAEARAEVLLVDQNNFLLFTPMLPEVAAGELDPLDIVRAPHWLPRRMHFRQGRVDGIDLAASRVTISLGAGRVEFPSSQWVVTADHLVITLGSVVGYHNIPGVEEHSLTLKSLSDAEAVRNRLLALVERASAEPDPAARRRFLTLAVGGGGFTGVETAAALNDFLRDIAAAFPEITSDDITTCVFQHGDRLLPEIGPALARYAQQELEKRGVAVWLNSGIARAGPGWVELRDGKRLEASTFIWSGGVVPNPLVRQLECEHGHNGAVLVDRYCRVPGYTGVWAAGDCAEVPHPSSSRPYPPTAQNATREGDLVAENIIASLSGRPLRPFRFRPVGEIALVGKHAGVASLYGLQFSGLPGWVLWRGVYLAKMPGARQRARVALSWLLDAAFGRSIAELPAPRVPRAV